MNLGDLKKGPNGGVSPNPQKKKIHRILDYKPQGTSEQEGPPKTLQD
jgi:hypothetical protein